MKPIGEIFLVDDEREILHACRQTFQLEGFPIKTFGSGVEVLPHIHGEWLGAVITDVKMPGMDGLELFSEIRKISDDIPVVILTGHGDVPMAIEAMHAGAFDFLEKPAPPERLLDVARRALETRRIILERNLVKLRLEKGGGEISSTILGESIAVDELRGIISSLAVIDVDVLLIGETGVGKELAARCLHDMGHRNLGEFVPVNCGAIPVDLVESELFGHEKGAFTNALNQRIGKIEIADGGTLFLDEIESMSPGVQIRLLRALQERKIERLGGNKSIKVDFRVVAASKIDLRDAVKKGLFRQDLFYRLNVARVSVPPLRQRENDTMFIFYHYTRVMAEKFGYEEPKISRGLKERLLHYHWPGNVRELRNVAQQFVLGLELDLDEKSEESGKLCFESGFDEMVNQYEKRLILEALDRTSGKIEKAANVLQIPRKRLYLRMQKHDINKE